MTSVGPTGGRSRSPWTAYFVGFLILFYGGWVALWAWNTPVYRTLLGVWGVVPVPVESPVYAKTPLPFFDLEGVLSWSECGHRGVDVFADNPCDPMNRPLNYSPLLRDLPLHWIGTQNTLAAGLAMDGFFLILLPFVFRPRSFAEFVLASAASASQSVLFALERANIDVLILGAIMAVSLMGARRGLFRFLQYGIAAAGGLVKFYPFVLLALALRESVRRFVVLSCGFALLLAGFAWVYWTDIGRALAHLPSVYYAGDMFGAFILPRLLHRGFGLSSTGAYIVMALAVLLLAWGATRLAKKLYPISDRLDFSDSRGLLLVTGSLVIFGCFWIESNVAYRAIFLLPVLPGLWAAQRALRGTDVSRPLLWAVGLVLGCLWADTMRVNIFGLIGSFYGGTQHPEHHWPARVFLLLREAMWWYVVCVLGAVLTLFVRQSPVFGWTARWIGRPQEQ